MSTTIRSKFKCTGEFRTEYHARKYSFAPVYSNRPDSENKAFWDASPQGTIELTITNEAAWTFVPGQEYYVDFSEAEPTVADA